MSDTRNCKFNGAAGVETCAPVFSQPQSLGWNHEKMGVARNCLWLTYYLSLKQKQAPLYFSLFLTLGKQAGPNFEKKM